MQEKSSRWILGTIVMANLAMLVTYLAFTFHFGSFGSGIRYLNGDRILVAHSVSDLGVFEPKQIKNTRFVLFNCGSKAIQIVGSRSTCSCVMTSDLPMTIPPGSKTNLVVKVHPSQPEGSFSERLTLYSDLNRQHTIDLTVEGIVIPKLEKPAVDQSSHSQSDPSKVVEPAP